MAAIAEGTCTPVDYPALGFLSACASLVGGKRKVRPYATAAWSEPCILWVGVVGDPSSRKSPALDAITTPLREIERDHADQHKLAIRGWQEREELAKASRKLWQDGVAKAAKDGLSPPAMPDNAVEPAEPVRRRTMIMDATPEAVGAILEGNPQGTLHFRDELAGWLTSFDRYSPGGREFWLEAYGGRSFVVDRKNLTKGPLSIPFNWRLSVWRHPACEACFGSVVVSRCWFSGSVPLGMAGQADGGSASAPGCGHSGPRERLQAT
jgi:putative DNA primase/helicase